MNNSNLWLAWLAWICFIVGVAFESYRAIFVLLAAFGAFCGMIFYSVQDDYWRVFGLAIIVLVYIDRWLQRCQ